jgi:hypothetical protein
MVILTLVFCVVKDNVHFQTLLTTRVGMASPNLCKVLRLLRLDSGGEQALESLKQTTQAVIMVAFSPTLPPLRD